MLVQLLKIRGCIVIGVVGSSHKVNFCKEVGADYVIDKSKQDLWPTAAEIANNEIDYLTGKERKEVGIIGYDCIFDANGVSTMKGSWNSLA